MIRTKSPYDLHMQFDRIRTELLKRDKYSPYPYQNYLHLVRASRILNDYADNFEMKGIDVNKHRHTQFKREVYAGH